MNRNDLEQKARGVAAASGHNGTGNADDMETYNVVRIYTDGRREVLATYNTLDEAREKTWDIQRKECWGYAWHDGSPATLDYVTDWEAAEGAPI